MDNGVVVAIQGSDRHFDLVPHLRIGQAEMERNHGVKNHIGVGGAGNHAEIVDGDLLIDAAGQSRQKCHGPCQYRNQKPGKAEAKW